jgi:hypothetical protein
MVELYKGIKDCLVDQTTANWVINIISLPNVGLFLRITPFIIFLDEFSYYKYHAATYDRSFVIISRLFWNWTNEKWVPIFLDDLYGEYSENISNWVSLSQNP